MFIIIIVTVYIASATGRCTWSPDSRCNLGGGRVGPGRLVAVEQPSPVKLAMENNQTNTKTTRTFLPECKRISCWTISILNSAAGHSSIFIAWLLPAKQQASTRREHYTKHALMAALIPNEVPGPCIPGGYKEGGAVHSGWL